MQARLWILAAAFAYCFLPGEAVRAQDDPPREEPVAPGERVKDEEDWERDLEEDTPGSDYFEAFTSTDSEGRSEAGFTLSGNRPLFDGSLAHTLSLLYTNDEQGEEEYEVETVQFVHSNEDFTREVTLGGAFLSFSPSSFLPPSTLQSPFLL